MATTAHKISGFGLGLSLACLVSLMPAEAQYRGTIQADGTVDNSGLIPFEQAFFAFEVESPVGTLKEVPTWDELEQALDNPYLFTSAPDVLGNFQGWESYRSTIPRRRSFIYRINGDYLGEPCAPGSLPACMEVQLPGFVIHPLNYNFQSGQELRTLNGDFEGADWMVPNPCSGLGLGGADCDQTVDPDTGQITFEFTYSLVAVSPGDGRVEEDEVAIDYNSPVAPEAITCVTTVEPIPPPEGSILCGADPGEPGYAGFGVLLGDRTGQYSVPAVPGGTADDGDLLNGPKGSIIGLSLYDPARSKGGVISPRIGSQAVGGLRRPSLRAEGQTTKGVGRIHSGTPGQPNYLHNSVENLAADPTGLLPSNENDYYAGSTRAAKNVARNEAAALGKALFWDMQVGSDSVQACGSCHFHAGVDDRIQGQVNSNTAGGDLTSLEMKDENGTTMTPNGKVGVNSFPLHKLVDIFAPTDPLVNPGNIERTTNDVMSSMGVSRFTLFVDIPPIGTFLPVQPGPTAVKSLPADIGSQVLDPFPINQDLRRVEPRHTPTFFAAPMNFDNFWDGRARHDFNGGSVFGASDPQAHVMVHNASTDTIVPTRQIIRFASLASLATGPALSENEMSFFGRNWAKIGKKLLQKRVTPLANQLVALDDSVLGLYSNQGGSACAALKTGERSPGSPAAGRPGLCINYGALIKRAFYPSLWKNKSEHLVGCYTDTDPERAALHPNQCAPGTVAIPVLDGGTVVDSEVDPFDNYVLSVEGGAADPSNTDEFTQMEANMALFFGLSVHAWVSMLIPDDSAFDRFMDHNSEAFIAFGEANENALVIDILSCDQVAPGEPCFTEVGNFRRDPDLTAKIDCPGPEGTNGCTFEPTGGTRVAGDPDPLLGLDFFLGSNLSLKNPNYNTLRCGECHAGGTLTDHTVEISHQLSFNDWAQEFSVGTPGTEIFPEPLGRGRVISGFPLEGEISGNAQDAIERNVADFCTIEPCQDVYGDPIPGGAAGGFPQGQALFDNGVYNIGVTPIGDDISRGGNDPFGWPLSLSRLMLKNVCGVGYTPGGDDPADGFAQPAGGGIPCPTFDPSIDRTGGGVFAASAQDQLINPGFEEEAANPLLPPHLAPWANNINVGDEMQVDEVFSGLNTRMAEPMLEGFIDSFGSFDPAAILGENMNDAFGDQMAMWPNVNRVNVQGAFKAPPLRNVELTNPYFHDGGNLTLRQQLDFYVRGGNFAITNKAHRDFLIMNLLVEDEALGGEVDPTTCDVTAPLGSLERATCTAVDPGTGVPQFSAAEKEEIIVSVVDFLLELTDERVKFERAPFDHPEIFVPLDGTAPTNGTFSTVMGNREGFLANLAGTCIDSSTAAPFPLATSPCFLQVEAVGEGGRGGALQNFLGISSGPRLVGAAAFCGVVSNHYCH
jgi:cytochrome c peroxidase